MGKEQQEQQCLRWWRHALATGAVADPLGDDSNTIGGSWQILGGYCSSCNPGRPHSAERGSEREVLHVPLPCAFTVPQQSAPLKFFGVSTVTIALDYGWGPSPLSKAVHSAACRVTSRLENQPS